MLQPLRNLLTGIVDYAGLFPPSALSMATAVENYAAYLKSPSRWMLGRIVVPVSRLDEFEQAARPLMPTGQQDETWRISGLIAPGDRAGLDRQIDQIFQFNSRHEEHPDQGRVVVDVIELKAADATFIDAAMRTIPEQLEPFFELDHTTDLRGPIAAIAGTGGRAKIRCGGITPDLIPAVEHLARFIADCAAADVAFKATAGLHHPVRAEQPLTYESNPPRAVMHGFLNVFCAAALAKVHRFSAEQVAQVLKDTSTRAFIFTESGMSWREHFVDAARIARVRESFAISFGSCSFTEPIADLRTIGLLAPAEA